MPVDLFVVVLPYVRRSDHPLEAFFLETRAVRLSLEVTGQTQRERVMGLIGGCGRVLVCGK